MFQTFFGNPRAARLGRLSYLGHYLALLILGMASMMIVATLTGISKYPLRHWTQEPAALHATALVGMVLVLVLMLTLIWAQLNLTAKRLRDIGLPGWITLALLIGVLMLFGWLMPSRMSGALNLLVMISLLVLPRDTFVKVRRDEQITTAGPATAEPAREDRATLE